MNWTDIKEKLPENNSRVLVYTCAQVLVEFFTNDHFYELDTGEKETEVDTDVTHWMRCPPPPPGPGIWYVASPTLDRTHECASYEDAMAYFEGYNIPYQMVNGKREPHSVSHERMRRYNMERLFSKKDK